MYLTCKSNLDKKKENMTLAALFIKLISIFSYSLKSTVSNPADLYLLKVNNRSTRTSFQICSKLTIKTPEGHQWRCSGVFVANFEHISHLVLVFLLLTLSRSMLTGKVFQSKLRNFSF